MSRRSAGKSGIRWPMSERSNSEIVLESRECFCSCDSSGSFSEIIESGQVDGNGEGGTM